MPNGDSRKIRFANAAAAKYGPPSPRSFHLEESNYRPVVGLGRWTIQVEITEMSFFNAWTHDTYVLYAK